ncbi:MAG: hypothetical protein AAFV09_13335 [Pseudomonadota bacterium]
MEVILSNAWVVVVLPILLGIIGAMMPQTVALEMGEGLAAKVPVFVIWMWGSFLILAVTFVAAAFGAVVTCGDAKTDGSGFELTSCSPVVRVWFTVIQEAQTAIGAILGLLAVAWASFFKAVYGTAPAEGGA